MRDKFVRLMYLDSKRRFELEPYIVGQWEPDWYYQVRGMPAQEMLADTSPDIAVELLYHTSSASWRAQQRRPIARGDIICIRGIPWLYCLTEELHPCRAWTTPAGTDNWLEWMNPVKLQVWPHFSILPLAEERARQWTLMPKQC
jgi:hypothetical protein